MVTRANQKIRRLDRGWNYQQEIWHGWALDSSAHHCKEEQETQTAKERVDSLHLRVGEKQAWAASQASANGAARKGTQPTIVKTTK